MEELSTLEFYIQQVSRVLAIGGTGGRDSLLADWNRKERLIL